MEFQFDKEIDALLRQTAQGESVFTGNNQHLDADEISAFAENASPEKAKQLYTKHFAECERCRKILSNVIALNSENVSAEETKNVAALAPPPWYRKLFAYPNLAFTMGALILVFSGLVAFVVLQNGSRSAEVSQVSERQPSGKGMASDGDAAAPETNFSNSSSFNSASTANSASVYSSNSAAANASTNSATRNFNSSAVSNRPNASPNQTLKEEPRREDEAAKNKTASQENNFAAGSVAEEKQERAKANDKETEADAAPKPAPVKSAPPARKSDQPDALDRSGAAADTSNARAKKTAAQDAETTTSGGKIFRRQNNIWVDAAYKGQAATNISRGTKEYKKLDAGLRSIAENLGGTVIVVWKEKAYRIQ